ncbi:MAG: hypothetical protein MHM6MM_001138 [Cercozoa sp. M6MM]
MSHQWVPTTTNEQLQFVAGAPQQPPITYSISGRPAFAFVQVQLGEGQTFLGDSGAYLWGDSTVQIETQCRDGPINSCGRCLSGEHLCINEFTGPGRVAFGDILPGDLLPFAVTPGNGWIMNQGAFVAATSNVCISARCPCCIGHIVGGEGVMLTLATVTDGGVGVVFGGGYGAIERHEVQHGQKFFVDNGLFFAAHEKASISVGLPNEGKHLGEWSFKNCLSTAFGGEGIVMKFYGPAVLYTQSRNPDKFWGQSKNPGNQSGSGPSVTVSA